MRKVGAPVQVALRLNMMSALVFPAVNVSGLKSGAEWAFFSGDFPWTPNVNLLTPEKTGITKKLDLRVKQKNNKGTVVYTGFIEIPQDGEYTFSITSEAGAFLRLHDCNVIDADFGYEPGTIRTGTILLKKGMHPFTLSCLYKTKNPKFEFLWSGPELNEQKVSAKNLFHN